MADNDANTSELNRRAVLRNVATGASVAFVGTATAESSTATELGESKDAFESHTELVQKYDPSAVTTDVDDTAHAQLVAEYADPATVEADLRGSVDPILAELSERGYLAEPSLDVFDLDTVFEDEILTPEDDRTGVATTTIDYDGVTTPHIMATTESNGYSVGLYHQPETDNSYALVDTGDDRLVVHSMDDGVSISGDCSTETSCGEQCCKCYISENWAYYSYEVTEECCLLADGSYDCDPISKSCGCSSDPPCC